MIEKMLEDCDSANQLKYISLRYFNVAGASDDDDIGEDHENETHLIPLLLQSLNSSSAPLKVFGNDYDTLDGSAIRDYVHVLDIADAHVKALEHLVEHKKSVAINLGTSKGFSVLEIIKEAEKVCQRDIPHEICKRRTGDPAVLVADNTMAKEILKWEPVHSSIKTILKTAWSWHQKKMCVC